MFQRQSSKKVLFALAVVIIIGLNLYTLSVAYPTLTSAQELTHNVGEKGWARDFFVYYAAAWLMIHNPSQIYSTTHWTDGNLSVSLSLTPYKYLPSFLLFILPLLSLSYSQAFWIFDAFQFALLPFIALLLYKLLEKKSPASALIILTSVLLLPWPTPGRGLSVSYFMSWAEGQTKILLTFLLLLSFYMGYSGKPRLSGAIYALSAFDVRFALLGLPLFLFYNRTKLKDAVVPAVAALVAFNLVIFYPGVAPAFLNMVLSSGCSTPFYTPSVIPLIMILSLLLVNATEIVDEIEKRFPRVQRFDLRIRLKKNA